jgi:hypothetical protein
MSRPSSIELEQLAGRFRLNCPNLMCTDTLRLICQVRGIIAVKYGYLMAQTRRNTAHLRNELADLLDEEAKKIP